MPHRSGDEALGLTERFRQRLRERRLPVTRQRLAIAGMVFRAEDHPSVLELEHRQTGRAHRLAGPVEQIRTVRLRAAHGEAKAVVVGKRHGERLQSRRNRGMFSCQILNGDLRKRLHAALVLRGEARRELAADADRQQ